MDPDDLPDYDDTLEHRRFEELLDADEDYQRWVELSYELHQQEQGEADAR